MFDLSGKVAFVTGGSRGIGRAIALSLAQAGADVAVLGRDPTALADTKAAITALSRRASVHRADVADATAMAGAAREAEQHLGPIDTLVCCAGIHQAKPFEQLAAGEWDRLLAVNVGGVLNAAHAVGPGMIARKRGSIIVVASIFSFVAAPENSIYCTSKGAVLAFARALAVDWARHGVRVNAICPGWINTELNAAFRADARAEAAMLRQIPLGRAGEPEDIGPLAVYLAADESRFATGQSFVIDGGQIAR